MTQDLSPRPLAGELLNRICSKKNSYPLGILLPTRSRIHPLKKPPALH